MYQAIIRREAVESIEQQRRDMIASSYSNPNWDSKENVQKRADYIREINQHFNEAIAKIYAPKIREQEVDWDNPFFAAHKREIERTRMLFGWAQDGRSAGEILELDEERKKRREKLDQS